MPGFRAARLWLFSCLLVSLTSSLFAQGARTNPSGAGEAADGDHPAERDQWFMQGRVAPKGKTAAEMRWQAYQQKIQMRAARIVAARQAGTKAALAPTSAGWTALGPAPLVSNPGSGQDYGFVSGRATSVLIDPADTTGNTVYLGGAYGGLWRTTNGTSGGFGNPGGVTWTPLIDTMGTLAVGAIAIQPGNATGTLSNTILVGTGEANSSADSYYGLGILRSTDAGQNWTLITQDTLGHPFHGMAFSKIAFNTANPNMVVAATATSVVGVLNGGRPVDNRGLYVSTNAGQTWTYETSVLDGSTSINPLSNSVTSIAYNAAAAKFYAAFRYHGFYSSTDGLNWTRLVSQPAAAGLGLNSSTTCPSTVVNPITCPIYRGEIAVVPGRNEIYVWYTDPGDGDQGIWKSINGGTSWTQVTDTGITNCGDPFGCGTLQGGYDLEIAAVPNGAGNTDLYAGTINLYKCAITAASPSCSGTGTNTFLNLTHVYNCNGHATVHPDQHGLDSMIAGGKDVMYFAHDGGIDRAVDAFTGLTTANCLTNQFDSLNGTLGSMTEFVSFSQDSTSSAILLGGTQDNDSPSTSQTNTNWHSVLGGDGGYNEINPNTTGTTGQWFTSNPPFTNNGVRFNINIFSCTLGSNCLEANFNGTTQNSDVGNDRTPFYPFYMLDPQAPAKMAIGTDCRVWRGDVSSGVASGFVALSDSFEAPGAVPCTGSEVNKVHALDGGGLTDANGSKVMYAVTEGTGPALTNPSGLHAGGEIWVSTNASGGIGTWSNKTGSINPNHYSMGAVAVDRSDATGNTAYVGLQGFNSPSSTSRVFQTTNAGATWTDFSGVLPNAPVNSLVVDSSTHTIYAGTDVGVFSSPTTAANWTEVGPAPGAGSGYIPDAPVTRLRMFNAGGSKRLRASTYGRGIWEFVLAAPVADFTVNVPAPTLTAYPSQTATFSGTLTAQNGYASPVNLSCTGTKPTTCAAATTPVTPTTGGAAFTINASNAATGDFGFMIHAAGTDSVPQIHDTAATLHVVDFTLGALSPTSVTVNVPNSSAPVSIPITPSSNFADSITFSCTNAPANVTCNFSPNPVPAGTTPVTMTVTTAVGAAPVANFALNISANAITHPAPVAKTKTLTLTITANADYGIAISNSPQTTTVLGQATFNGTLTASNGYASPVNLSCGAGAPATCTVTTSPTIPTAGGAAFTVAATNPTPGTFNFNINGVGTDGLATKHSAAVTLTVNADFHVPATTTTCAPVTAGGTSTCSIAIGPDGQATFANAVTYPCPTTGFPNLSTCTFNPTTITAGMPATTVTLSIKTTMAVASLRPSGPFQPSGPLFAFWLSLPAMGIVSLGSKRGLRKRLALLGGALLVVALVGLMTGCGGSGGSGGGQPGTNKGVYTFNVDATSNGIKHSAPMTLTVN